MHHAHGVGDTDRAFRAHSHSQLTVHNHSHTVTVVPCQHETPDPPSLPLPLSTTVGRVLSPPLAHAPSLSRSRPLSRLNDARTNEAPSTHDAHEHTLHTHRRQRNIVERKRRTQASSPQTPAFGSRSAQSVRLLRHGHSESLSIKRVSYELWLWKPLRVIPRLWLWPAQLHTHSMGWRRSRVPRSAAVERPPVPGHATHNATCHRSTRAASQPPPAGVGCCRRSRPLTPRARRK